MNLKFLTINIAGVHFNWFEGRRNVLINEINKLSPDFVFLQETTFVPEKNYDQTKDIGESIGLANMAFAPYGNLKEFESPRLGGIGILSRMPFKEVQIRKLPGGRLDKNGARVALMGKVQVDGKELILATTHLSWRPQEEKLRIQQTQEFMKMLSEAGESVVFGGDFNAAPVEKAVRDLNKDYTDLFHLHHPKDLGATWLKENPLITSSWRGSERIDYLFSTPEIKSLSCEVVLNSPEDLFPSDHLGVLANLTL